MTSNANKKLDDDAKKFFREMHNIETNRLIQYHNFLRDQLALYYQEENRSESEKSILRNFDILLHKNTFLMVYSFLEGELYQIAKHNNIAINSNENSIRKFEPLINSYDNKNLSESSEWNKIRLASKVRNTLLHCDGILEASKDKNCIKQLIEKKDSTIKNKNGKLTLTSGYLSDFITAIKSLKTKVVRLKKKV